MASGDVVAPSDGETPALAVSRPLALSDALCVALGSAEPLTLPLGAALAVLSPLLPLALADDAALGDGGAEPEPCAPPDGLWRAEPEAVPVLDAVCCSDDGTVVRGDSEAVALLMDDAVAGALVVAGAVPVALPVEVLAALPLPPARDAVAAPDAVARLVAVAPRDVVVRGVPLPVALV